MTHKVVYSEGDRVEIERPLRINEIVGVDARPLPLPLGTTRILAYEVYRIAKTETRNEEIIEYHLRQIFPEELSQYLG